MTRPHSVDRILAMALTAAVLFLPGARVHAGEPLTLASARVTVSGNSNVHPYEASTTTVIVTRLHVAPAAAVDVDTLVAPGVVEAFAITIPAATLTSPREGLDKNMHKALKVHKHADITFSLTRLERATAPNAFRGIGTLTIAGVEHEVALDLTILKTETALSVKGTLPLLMTDYGITPPKAMLGMLKTDPKVVITFETVFSIPTT